VINAQGEAQAAENLYDAAQTLGRSPTAIQLRYLQTLVEIGGDQRSTVVFPMPLDLAQPILAALAGQQRDQRTPDSAPSPGLPPDREPLGHGAGHVADWGDTPPGTATGEPISRCRSARRYVGEASGYAERRPVPTRLPPALR